MESSRTTKTDSKGFQIVSGIEPSKEYVLEKTCSKCGTTYTGNLKDYFSPREKSADGYRSQCRDCINSKQRKRRSKAIDPGITNDEIREIFKEAAKEILFERLTI